MGSSLVIILQASGAHPVNNAFIQGASDLQFVLHHVEGVVREVDLLDALDDLLLRLGVDGLLPQLPQLLLKEGPRETDKRQRERELKDVFGVRTLESSRHTGTQTEKVQKQRFTSFPQ